MVPLRLCKATLVAAISLFFLIVVANNITDYDSNYEFVRHVLSMDDTFPHNSELWRSLPYPILFQIFYAGIILTEAVSALLCGYGAYRLAKTSRLSGSAFYEAKVVATVGLVISLLLWLVAFLVIGGEWFLMWQSQHWNGQSAAFRMFGVEALILIFLWQEEDQSKGDKL